MLDSLTDRQREAVYLRYTQGLSYEEIGKLMGIQPKAAQKLVYRAIEQMRKIQPQIIYFFLFGYFLLIFMGVFLFFACFKVKQ